MFVDFSIDALQPPALRPPLRGATPPPLALSPYQAGWPARFRIEAEVLRVALNALAPRVEHVGSTAVPAMAARPVIDMLLGLPAPVTIDAYASRLANFGYSLLPAVGDDTRAPRVLVRQLHGVRSHFALIVQAGSDAWHRMLLFRDILRHDGQVARQYALAKLDLLQRHGDGLAYADGKARFMTSVVGVGPCRQPAVANASR